MPTDIASILQSALTDHQEGRLEKAEQAYREILEIQPKHPVANHNFGILMLQRHEPQSALPYFFTALETDPNNAQHWLSLIECMLRNEMWNQAHDLLQTVKTQGLSHPSLSDFELRIDTAHRAAESASLTTLLAELSQLKSARPRHMRSKLATAAIQHLSALFANARFDEVISSALAALRDSPEEAKLWHLLGMALLERTNTDHALLALNKASDLNPRDSEIWAHKGHVLYRRREFDQAETCFKRSLTLAPNNAEALNLAGQNALDANNYPLAISYLSRSIKANPRSAQAHNNLGNALQKQGDLQSASAHYEEALKLAPNFTPARDNLAALHVAEGQFDKAIHHFQQAEAIAPEDPEMLCRLGYALLESGDPASAVTRLEHALALQPNHAEAHNNLAAAYQNMGQFRQALTHAHAAVASNPQSITALNNLAGILLIVGQPSAAIPICERSITICSHNPAAVNALGWAYRDTSQTELALEQFQRATALDPTYVEAFINAANLARDAGQTELALEYAHRALELRPGSPEAAASLGRILTNQRRFSEAEETLQRALDASPDSVHCLLAMADLAYTQGRNTYAATLLQSAGEAALQKNGITILLAMEWLASLLHSAPDRFALPTVFRRLANFAHGLERYQGILASYAMVHAWIVGDDAELLTLREAAPGYLALPAANFDNNQRVFYRLACELVKQKKANPHLYTQRESAPLFVVGESHSLAPANAIFHWLGKPHKAEALLTMGVKMYHLAQENPNRYKTRVEQRIQSVPLDAPMLFTIGEIDCRADEGIWPVYEKSGQELDDLIVTTVEGYLCWLAQKLGDRAHRLITLQGVPAPMFPRPDHQTPKDLPTFLGMIQRVNAALQAGTHQRGWHFLDVYGATAGPDGSSHGRWHIDAHHMLPAFYATADDWLS